MYKIIDYVEKDHLNVKTVKVQGEDVIILDNFFITKEYIYRIPTAKGVSQIEDMLFFVSEEGVFVKIYSRISVPPNYFRLEKPEWLEGEKLDGFTFPLNFYGGADTLFRRFGLWCSNLGVMNKGVNWVSSETQKIQGRENHLIKNVISQRYFWTHCPILTGDTINGKDVVYSESLYLDKRKVWENRVDYGNMPDPNIIEEDFRSEYLENLETLHKKTQDAICKLLDDYNEKLIKTCKITVNIPSLTGTGLSAFGGNVQIQTIPQAVIVDATKDLFIGNLEPLKQSFLNSLSEIMKQIKETEWE